MATTKGQGMAIAGCNYVAQDKIWKDHVGQEMTAAKKWPDNWQFLTQDYKEVVKDEFPIKERQKIPPPTPLRLPEVTPLEELVTVHPSPKPVPLTTSAMIGWRSSKPKLNLECYGGYAKPKGAIEKTFNWPIEGIE